MGSSLTSAAAAAAADRLRGRDARGGRAEELLRARYSRVVVVEPAPAPRSTRATRDERAAERRRAEHDK